MQIMILSCRALLKEEKNPSLSPNISGGAITYTTVDPTQC